MTVELRKVMLFRSRALAFLPMLTCAGLMQAQHRPNIVIIFTDDQGYQDLGCYGSPLIQTPAIDGMAREGLKLTDFYVSASVSSASRAGLLTGRLNTRNGVKGVFFPESEGMPSEEITLAEALKEQGYATGCFGKWHLGDLKGHLPTDQGFDKYFGIPYSNDMDRPYCPLPLMEQEEVIVAPVGHDSLTIRYTNKTVEFIKSHKESPFFIYLCHNMTHNPLAASPAFKGKSQNGLYGDAIEELDWSMGVLLETLKEEGLDQNTLIIFTSDNGADEHFGGTNRPLRGQKGTTYEGGFRVPCIMRWPAKIPAGQETDNLVTSMDFLPTLAHYCGYAVPSDRVIDGHNVSGILEGESMASPTETFYYYQKQQLQAVRWGNWKYHLPLKERIKGPHFPDTEVGEARLYNLANDLSETTNVIDKHPEVVTKMNQWIEQVRSDMGDWGYEGRNQRPAGIIDEPFPRLLK